MGAQAGGRSVDERDFKAFERPCLHLEYKSEARFIALLEHLVSLFYTEVFVLGQIYID